MKQAQALAVLKFSKEWLSTLIPDLQAIKVKRGTVSAKDSIGWREVGQVADFVSLARALGRI